MSAVTGATGVRHRRTRLLAALAATFTACLVVAVGPAVVAQESSEASPLSVRRIDATDPENVSIDLIWTGDRSALTDITIREGGQERPNTEAQPLSSAGVKPAIVVAVDTSRSMATNGGVRQTQETLRTLVDNLEEGEAMGLVSFGTDVEVLSKVTTDRAQLGDAIDELVAPETGKTALWDGVRKGASLFADVPDLQPNLIIVTDGFADEANTTSASQAASEVARYGAAVFALAYDAQDQVDLENLTALVDRVGGAVIAAPTEDDLAAGLTQVQRSLDEQYRVSFASSGEQGAADLEITVGNEKVQTTFVSGAVAEGQANLTPPSTSKSLLPSFVRGTAGLVAVLVVGGLAVFLAVVAIAMVASKDDSSLDRMLQQYTEGGVAEDVDDGLAQTAFIQRAVELTGEIATRQGALVKVEKKLERADLPLRAAEALFFYIAAGVVVTILGIVLLGLLGILLGAVVGFVLPMAVLNFLGARRQKKFNAQLPDMLQLLSGSLRAGYSLVQGVDAVSAEVDGPMGRELLRVMTEARLGRELEDALEASAARVQSNDFEWAIMAIRIQREVGGNLSELLMTVADTMVDRERLRRDVSTLTAEGKLSAGILGFMPIGLGAAIYVMNPSYMGILFTAPLGKALLGGAVVMMGIGLLWMKKCITIEV